jgi:hypothetical protein
MIGGGIGGFIFGQVVTQAALPDIRVAVAKKNEIPV